MYLTKRFQQQCLHKKHKTEVNENEIYMKTVKK